jgi:shikimate kinase
MTRPVELPAARVLLLGMMGSGKSSVGRAVSVRTGWAFIDNDALVERATGMTARQLLAREGEDAMRDAEAAALAAGLAIPAPVVVAAAAGTILDPAARERMRAAGLVVWLRAPAEVLAGRAVGSEHRPWLDEDPVAWFVETMAERGPLYASVADLEVDTAVTAPDEAADAVVEALATIHR